MADAAATTLTSNRINRRLAFLRWLRRMHGWFGLWGAILGLLMGFSGIWLNHRTVLKLQLPDQQQINAQLELTDPPPATIDALAAWLQQALTLDRSASNMRVERSRPVAWSEKGAGEGRPLTQPERWTLSFGGPDKVIQVEYCRRNNRVERGPREWLPSRRPICSQGRGQYGCRGSADRQPGGQPDLPV
jgi:hypothetical protein